MKLGGDRECVSQKSRVPSPILANSLQITKPMRLFLLLLKKHQIVPFKPWEIVFGWKNLQKSNSCKPFVALIFPITEGFRFFTQKRNLSYPFTQFIAQFNR